MKYDFSTIMDRRGGGKDSIAVDTIPFPNCSFNT